MTEVSFYLLSTEAEYQRQLFACKLIEKAYRSGCFCAILTDSETYSHTFDDLLWTFRPNSFIPHEIYQGKNPNFANTVIISHSQIPLNWQRVILNLSSTIPPELTQTQRILEILNNHSTVKQFGRQRYRQYKELGFTLNTHQID
ncbi:MAG: hypothetical protein RL637_1170 [Pseudomonadota bacterium]|jgi:DNA polymerase-3 subunit chi